MSSSTLQIQTSPPRLVISAATRPMQQPTVSPSSFLSSSSSCSSSASSSSSSSLTSFPCPHSSVCSQPSTPRGWYNFTAQRTATLVVHHPRHQHGSYYEQNLVPYSGNRIHSTVSCTNKALRRGPLAESASAVSSASTKVSSSTSRGRPLSQYDNTYRSGGDFYENFRQYGQPSLNHYHDQPTSISNLDDSRAGWTSMPLAAHHHLKAGENVVVFANGTWQPAAHVSSLASSHRPLAMQSMVRAPHQAPILLNSRRQPNSKAIAAMNFFQAAKKRICCC